MKCYSVKGFDNLVGECWVCIERRLRKLLSIWWLSVYVIYIRIASWRSFYLVSAEKIFLDLQTIYIFLVDSSSNCLCDDADDGWNNVDSITYLNVRYFGLTSSRDSIRWNLLPKRFFLSAVSVLQRYTNEKTTVDLFRYWSTTSFSLVVKDR